MEKAGTKQVPVIGKEDKREITVLLSVAAAGDFFDDFLYSLICQ